MVIIQTLEEGRQKDGDRVIAHNIIKRLDNLEMTLSINQGRWAWELLQNAKDTYSETGKKKVSVQIILKKDYLKFKHNGSYFTEKDIRGLINQITSKEGEEGQNRKKTGRFGTGFLTTHLLSRKVHVKGILKDKNKTFHSFSFELNREGQTTSELVPRIDKAWRDLQNSATKIDGTYKKSEYNTSFTYQLETKRQKDTAKIGVTEFLKLIPYVLVFVPKIEIVEVFDEISNNKVTYQRSPMQDDLNIVDISKMKNGKKSKVYILHFAEERLSIACRLTKKGKEYFVKPIEGLPKVFCDFPLIGTEKFHFPVLINSSYFNPTDERNNIWLKEENRKTIENQDILRETVKLYKKLLAKLESAHFHNIFNVVNTRLPEIDEIYFDNDWFKENMQKKMREIIFDASIVETYKASIKKEKISEMWFPLKSYKPSDKRKIWEFYSVLYPNLLCKRDHMQIWSEISWNGWKTLDIEELMNDIGELETISNLRNKDEMKSINPTKWLKEVYNFILEDERNLYLFNHYAVIPNQFGKFQKRRNLYVDNIKDPDLLEILRLLGDNWEEILMHDILNMKVWDLPVKDKSDISDEITELIREMIYDLDIEIQKDPILLLLTWFTKNEKSRDELFSELYKKEAELLLSTMEESNKERIYSVLQSINKNPELLKVTEDVLELFENLNIKNIEELKYILSNQNGLESNQLTEITQEVLINLGISSLEELESALANRNFSSQFFHTSTHSKERFDLVQELIERSKRNVISYLKTIEEYDCSEIEESAQTVIAGIEKNGVPVSIVVRPSDHGHVIIHSEAEIDTLDYEYSELWIDNGIDTPQHLTLGKIFRKTGINRIMV